jgi:hypothetical protein
MLKRKTELKMTLNNHHIDARGPHDGAERSGGLNRWCFGGRLVVFVGPKITSWRSCFFGGHFAFFFFPSCDHLS